MIEIEPWRPAPPAPKWRLGTALLFGSLGLAVALIGLTVWLLWPSPPNLEPFNQAVAALADARGVRYTSNSGDLDTRWDITTTEFGQQQGTISIPNPSSESPPPGQLPPRIERAVLRIDGVLYSPKRPNGADSQYVPLLNQLVAPALLAARLKQALEAPPDPSRPAGLEVQLKGGPALQAKTEAGTVYVTSEAPYRVLGWAPSKDEPTQGQQPTRPSTPFSDNGFSIDAVTDDQAPKMYNTLEHDIQQLGTETGVERLVQLVKQERERKPCTAPGPTCGDLGTDWKPKPVTKNCDPSGCAKATELIMSKIGGQRFTIRPPKGMPDLGRYRGQQTEWGTHPVVVRDGRVYDEFSGRTGVPLAEYKSLWADLDRVEFPF